MVSSHFFKSDLNQIHGIVQNTMNLHSKEIILFSLRDYFAQDSFYRYVTDHYGYPKVVGNTHLSLDSGINDDSTTRISIQESYRMEADSFPALIVRTGGFTSVPISFNRESGSVKWGSLTFQDGYGNIKTFPQPEYFIFAGAWEGTINIDIMARDMRARDDLVDIVSLRFVSIAHNELIKEGIVVTGVSTSGPAESDDRNTKIYKETISLKIRTEWRRHINISNSVQIIHAAIEFGQLPQGPIAQNLTINMEQNILEALSEL